MTTTNTQEQDKTLKAMKNFAEQYAKRTDTYFCVDPSVTAVVIEGLARHKDELGIVPVYRCVNVMIAIVCSSLLLIMNLQESNRKLKWKLSKKSVTA